MVVDPAMSWSELAAVIFGLVLEGRETESGRGPTDLFALADSLAEAAGGAVIIEDRLSRVLAYSRRQQHADPARVATIIERQAPEQLRAFFDARGVYAHLAASDEPLFVTRGPRSRHDRTHGGRGAIGPRTHGIGVGGVHGAVERGRAHRVGRRCPHRGPAPVAVTCQRGSRAPGRIRTRDPVTGGHRRCRHRGQPHSACRTPVLRVIAVQAFIGAERDAALLLAFERATTGFGWSRPGRSALAGNTVYTLLPGEQSATARKWVTGLQAALPERITVLAGISGAAEVADLAAARHEADECLALHEIWPTGAAPPAYDESWDDILLQRLRTAARSGRSSERGPVAELRRHDRDHATDYVPTLRAWLEAQGDPAEAGDRLGVHENTVRYRLSKMAEITNLQLHDTRSAWQ